MTPFDILRGKPLPQDKANHNVGGTYAAMAGAVGTLVILTIGLRMPQLPPIPHAASFVLVAAAVMAVVIAYGAGVMKEHLDQIANDAADKAGTPRPHSVEVADWQMTAWGALPVAVPLVIAAMCLLVV